MIIINECLERLPEVEMYGGDTRRWALPLEHEDGTPYTPKEAESFTFELSISHDVCVPLCGTGSSPILVKTGVARPGDHGSVFVTFEFSESDTLMLGGRFVYQIVCKSQEERRVSQGFLTIYPNIHRGTL